MYRGYVTIQGAEGVVEIVNNDRTLAYMKGNKAAGAVPLKGRSTKVTKACECEPLAPLFCEPGSGPNGEYISPAADDAPWFDADVSDSTDFAGFFCESVTGFDSLYKRKVYDDAIEGGALGPLRLKSRRMRFTGWVRARTCCGADYGLEWLTSALKDSTNCEGCDDGEMNVFRCCPPSNTCALTTVSTFEFDCSTSLTGCQRVAQPLTTIITTGSPTPTVGINPLGNGIYRFNFQESNLHSNMLRLAPGSGGGAFDGVIPQFADASPGTALQFAWIGVNGVSQLANNFAFSIPYELVIVGSGIGGLITFPIPFAIYSFEIDLKREVSCTGLEVMKALLEQQIADFSASYGLGTGASSQLLAAVAAIEPILITAPPVTCQSGLTITDDGGSLYTFSVDDAQLSGAVSTQSGAANNLDGFIPTCWDGLDPNAVLTWEVSVAGELYRFDIPLPALTGAITYTPSGGGNTATFQVDTNFSLIDSIDCFGRAGLLTSTQGTIDAWLTIVGDGVLAATANVSGRCKTLAPNTVDESDVNRALFGVGLVDGPKVIERSGSCSEEDCGASTCGHTNLRVQFTLATGNPYLFGDITYCIEDQPFDTSTAYVHPMYCEDPCPDIVSAIVNPDCGPGILTPPSPSLVGDDCYCEPLGTFRACCTLENILDWQEAAGVISIQAGSTDLRNISIKAFENPTGSPCPCQPESDDFWRCNDTCSNIQIPFLPSGAELILDGRTKTATVIFSGGESVQGLKFVQAANGEPFDFFNVGDCASLCIVVAVDCGSHNDDARVSIGTAPRYLTSG